MSSFSDWCEQGEAELRRARQDVAGSQKYPRLADYDAADAPPAAEPESPVPSALRRLVNPVSRNQSAASEAPERWDSLW